MKLIDTLSASAMFLFLFGLAEVGLPQYVRLVAGPLFGPTNATRRKRFYEEYSRGRLVRFGIALVLSLAAGLSVGFFDRDEIKVGVLIAVVTAFCLLIGGAVWTAAQRTRAMVDSEKAK